MSERPREIPDEEGGNPFLSLRQLLSAPQQVTVGTLATAIENHGIYSWDRYGRFKKFSKETPEFQRALELLAMVHKFEDDESPRQDQHPLDEANGLDDPFVQFGWAQEVAPDFKAIRSVQMEAPSKKQPGEQRMETSNLRIIAALLQYVSGGVTGVEKHPHYKSEAELILTLEAEHKGTAGLSQRNFQDKFAQAKRAMISK